MTKHTSAKVLGFLIVWCLRALAQIPGTTETWELLESSGGDKWSARNGECYKSFDVECIMMGCGLFAAHASCSFKGKLWLTGGRSDLHPLYNLENSHKSADVWFSSDGKQLLCHAVYFMNIKPCHRR